MVKSSGLAVMLLACFCWYANPVDAATELTYWTFLDPASNDVRSLAQNKQIKRFEELNPDIKIKVEIVHWSKQVDMYIQATAAGKGPDAAVVYQGRVPQVVAAKTVEPLEPYAKELSEAEKGDFIIPWKDHLAEFDGKLWCFNLDLRTSIMFYRKKLLAEAGVPVPTSWDDIVTGARKLTKGRVYGFVFPLSSKDAATGWGQTIPLFFSKGTSVVDAKGKAIYDGPVGAQVFQLLADMVLKDKVMPPTPLGMEETRTAYKAGVVAMYADQTQMFGDLKAVFPDTGSFPIPSLAAAQPAPGYGTGQTITMGINSKNKPAAWKFIKFMIGPEANLINAQIAKQLPTRKAVLKDPFFRTEDGAEMSGWGNYLAKYGQGFKAPELLNYLMDSMARAFEKVVVGKEPIPQALAFGVQRYNQRAGF